MKTVKGELELGRFLVPYRIYGEAEKTIICISGAKQTMAAWRSFVSHFVNDYSVVVFDLPGQGRATILSGDPGISFDEQVDVLHNIVKETNRNGTVVLAAASWGTITTPRKRGVESKPLDGAQGHELVQWPLDELGTSALVPTGGAVSMSLDLARDPE